MDKYEHSLKMHRIVTTYNFLIVLVMIATIIYTGNLWWLLLLLAGLKIKGKD